MNLMTKFSGLVLINFALLFITGQNLLSQNLDSLLNNKRAYYAQSIGKVPSPGIDGKLDDPAWELGQWQGDFTQQQPYGGRKGSERTWIKILYDFSGLYVAIACNDSEPAKIRDMLDRRDAISGDMTGIAIDSYHDRKTAFEFNLSAAGQKMDLKHQGDTQWDTNWDAVWDGATSKNDTGWIAEMWIPFSQLRYSGNEEHVWGMHVWRWIERKSEEDQWQYIPREAPAMVYLFGELKGIKNIRESRQVEFLPYVLGSIQNKDATGKYPLTSNAGLDAKIGIHSNFTLDLSVNPDFGQVEADPSVLNLTSYETFYNEKRPFFLEGNDIFDFRLGDDIPYYSRRIGSMPDLSGYYLTSGMTDIPGSSRIISAAKITGKNSNGLSIGIVNGLTAREYARGTDSLGEGLNAEVKPLSNYLASRIKKEFNKGNSSLGGFVSMVNRFTENREVIEYLPEESYTAGFDMLHHWKNRNYFIEIKSITSQLKGSANAILLKQLSHNHRFQRPGAVHLGIDSSATQLAGSGGMVTIGKKGGKWNYSLEGQYRSPGLNLNDMGYLGRSDYIGERTELSYDMNEPSRLIRNYSIKIFQEAMWSFGGEVNRNVTGMDFKITSLKLWSLGIDLDYEFSALDTRELRGGQALRYDPHYLTGIWIRSNYAKNLFGSLSLYHTDSPKKDFAMDNLELAMTVLPMRQLRLSGNASVSRRNYYQQYVNTIYSGTDAESIIATLDQNTISFTMKAELFMSPEISLQYYGNPYFSSGKYSSFKRVAEADSRELNKRFELINPVYDPDLGIYNFDKNGNTMKFSDPDFSFVQYRSNLVFRWEYQPGSTLYLVWSHDRSDWQQQFSPVDTIMPDLFRNLFMLKLNYWFSV